MKIILQIAVVFAICWVGEIVAAQLPIPFPASVLSMILLFILLMIRFIRVEHIREKAEFMTKNMAVFFIPAGVGIIDNYIYVQGNVLPLLTVCFVSTVLTFLATGWTVKAVIRLQERLSTRREGK